MAHLGVRESPEAAEARTVPVRISPEAARGAVELVCSMLGCPLASIEQVVEGYVHLVAVASDMDRKAEGRVPLEMHPCHRAIRERAVCRLNDAGRIFSEVPWFEALAVNSYVSVPVLDSAGGVVAYLGAMDHGKSAFGDEDVKLLWDLSRRVAKTLARDPAADSPADMAGGPRLRMAKTLLKSVETDELASLALDCLIDLAIPGVSRNLALFLFDENSERLVLTAYRGITHTIEWCPQKLALGECLCGRAAETRQPVFEPHVEKCGEEHMCFRGDIETHGDLCLPMVAGDALVGVLRLHVGEDMSRDSRELAGELAGMMASAFYNARLCAAGEGQAGLRAKIESQLRRIRELQIGLAQAQRAKSEFLSGMSHELRTPLNAILGFSQVLQEEYFGALNDKQKQYVKDILESGKHLLDLISDILDLSRVESGIMELELSRVSVAPLLNGSLVMIREKAHKHNIRLEVDLDDFVRELSVVADERKLKQIMYNLLSNAVKFTPDGGVIRTGARLVQDGNEAGGGESQNTLEVFVSDTGIGVEPEDRERIFEDFYQVRRGTSGKTPGTGLGLPLTRRLVEMHGGRIRVESPGKDQGARFAFTLPLDAAEIGGDGAE